VEEPDETEALSENTTPSRSSGPEKKKVH
jgi:hypothetical protein